MSFSFPFRFYLSKASSSIGSFTKEQGRDTSQYVLFVGIVFDSRIFKWEFQLHHRIRFSPHRNASLTSLSAFLFFLAKGATRFRYCLSVSPFLASIRLEGSSSQDSFPLRPVFFVPIKCRKFSFEFGGTFCQLSSVKSHEIWLIPCSDLVVFRGRQVSLAFDKASRFSSSSAILKQRRKATSDAFSAANTPVGVGFHCIDASPIASKTA